MAGNCYLTTAQTVNAAYRDVNIPLSYKKASRCILRASLYGVFSK